MCEHLADRSCAVTPDALVYTDGASRNNPGPAAAAYQLFDSSGELLRADAVFLGRRTNNEAEYQAVLFGMEAAMNLRKRAVRMFCDSNLIVRQIRGDWKVNEERLRKLLTLVREKAKGFQSFEIEYLPREHPRISAVDALANKELDRAERRGTRGRHDGE